MLFFSSGFYASNSSKIIVSTVAPTSTDGNTGNIWIQVS
jgi:hypothetical protein